MERPIPIMWSVQRPEEWLLAIPGRRLNPFFALAEVVWMWSGKGGAEFITYYNKSMAQFLDPGVPYFNAAYGRRVRHAGYAETPFRDIPYPRTTGQVPEAVEVDQLTHVINKLQADPHTRQAAISLWDPIKDNFTTSKDHPCNNMVYFSLREGKLNITVVIRSNDLIWGVPYNMIQFSHLQALIAGSLEVEIGHYTVMCNNLHYYTDLYNDTLECVRGWSNNISERSILLQETPSNSLFSTQPDMRWGLDQFDQFMPIWEVLESQMRGMAVSHAESSSSVVNAAFNTRLMTLDVYFEAHRVPEYWRMVFLVLFMFHCRKCKAMGIFNEVLEKLPNSMKWAINDFIQKD